MQTLVTKIGERIGNLQNRGNIRIARVKTPVTVTGRLSKSQPVAHTIIAQERE